MSCDVFANNNEISCKKGGNKVIAEFPDVCLSPPSPPAGPIPVPYPDTSFSKDMKNGSKTVKIKGGEVMLKDKSFYKTSPLGDEAATKGLGANVITHTITGKTYFVAWSMDVKFEGKNVDRHIDMTTSNHMSPPGGTGPTGVSMGAMSNAGVVNLKCKDEWDDCQRKQMCAKVDSLNETTPLKKQPVTPAMKTAKKKYAADYREKNPAPGGSWTDDCAKTNGKPVDADHVADVQGGGDVKGHFEYLDMSVNRSIGKQMDLSNVDPAESFTTDPNCGC